MTRRTSPRSRIDDLAFPVRVKIVVPPTGLGTRLNDLLRWLREQVGPHDFAHHPAEGLGTHAMAFYVRSTDQADAFVSTHPDLVLADGTTTTVYAQRSRAEIEGDLPVCNLYAMTRTQDEMRSLFADLGAFDRLGNLGPLDQIYPDYAAPILRNGDGGHELVSGRWGMPTPPQFLKGRKTDRGVTNVRNARSPHWRRWLGVEHRCLVPFTAFAEPHHRDKQNVWFHMADDRPAVFAGIWTRWTSVRKLKDGETTDDLFAFLTTGPNAEVGAVHPKAMPVILTDPAEWEAWMSADWSEASELQRKLPDGALTTV